MKINPVLLLSFLFPFMVCAQITAQVKESSLRISVLTEARVTNYLFGGYDFAVFIKPVGHWSFGVQVAGQPLQGFAKRMTFKGDNLDPLSMRLLWLVGLKSRYHFSDTMKGFFGEVSVGGERFSVQHESEKQQHYNAFIVPAIGFSWNPGRIKGFYVTATVGASFTFWKDYPQTIHNVTYELRDVFFVPSVSLGYVW